MRKAPVMRKISPERTKKIAFIAVMVALTIVFSFVPISFGPVTLALMILPLLITALCQDFLTTLAVGCFLGLINYLAWFTTKAASPIAAVFQNPLVCILPRIMIGVTSWGFYNGTKAIIKKLSRPISPAATVTLDAASGAIATAIGVVTNTGLVSLFTLLFFSGKTLSSGTAIDVEFILAWFGLNFIIEIVAFSLIVPPISAALKKARLTGSAETSFSRPKNNAEKSDDVSDSNPDSSRDGGID